MRERYELGLKVACALLAGWLLFQVGGAMMKPSPLMNLQIPALPTLASGTATNSAPGKTNSANSAGSKGKTNSGGSGVAVKGTNSASDLAAGKDASNSVSTSGVANEGAKSKAPAHAQSGPDSKTKEGSITAESSSSSGTNGGSGAKGASNLVASAASGPVGTNKASGTNTNSKAKKAGPPPDMAMMMAGGPGRPGGQKAADLAPAVQARVDKIVDSELLGPVIHPMPMALLGIAGNVAFIRSPSGQTGLVKEGDEMGGIKLLRIGTNRVLVEQSGEKKELMIFSGYGGESLMPKENEKTNEPTSKKS